MQTEARTDLPPTRRHRPAGAFVRRAALCLPVIGIAFVIRWLLEPYLGGLQPFAVFYIAVAVIAWWEGWKSATCASIAGLLLGWFFFLGPRYSFRVENVSDLIQILTYCAVAFALVLLMNRVQKAERLATALVSKRTTELEAANEKLRREVVEHQETEAGLRASEERFRLLIDAIKDYAIFRVDPAGNVVTWNPGAERLYGYAANEIIGQHVSRFYIPEDIQANKAARELTSVVEQGRYFEEGWRVRRDGSRFWASVTIAAVRDASGMLVGMAKITRDVTERMEMEEQLRNTIADLEHFSYSITHDMRAPLRAMQGFAHILNVEIGLQLNDQQRDFLRRIVVSAERMDALIRDALNYSKIIREELELKPIDSARLLRDMLESYPEFQPPRVQIDVQDNIPPVLGNEAMLTQCFSNLLDNAVKFVAPGVTPQVRISGEALDGFVRLWFEDNGIGIAPEYRDRIFKMFQRIDQSRDGTGIGLAIVRKVVERLGGRVGVESAPGQGSRFWLDLKKAD
jgi:PAS domain S-box-containing protein